MMADEERRFLHRLLIACADEESTLKVNFGPAEGAFHLLDGAGGKKGRQPYTTSHSIEYVELTIGDVSLTAQITVAATEDESRVIEKRQADELRLLHEAAAGRGETTL